MSKINQIESYYDLRYGFVGGDTDTAGTANESMSHTSLGGLKLTVFVIDEVSQSVSFASYGKCGKELSFLPFE